MTLTALLVLTAFLVVLNGFFVLAEFAAVKLRATRTSELVAQGRPGASLVQHVQGRLEEYLSVCQVGITLASIGLGFVGEPAFAELGRKVFSLSSTTAHALALGVAYVLVATLHIVFGELLPKSLAIRRPERAALWTARPLRLFHRIFYAPLLLLNGATMGLLRLLGVSRVGGDVGPTENELRIMVSTVSAGPEQGSLTRLVLIENAFDLRGILTRHLTRPRAALRVLRLDAPWSENLKIVIESRLSRLPVCDAQGEPRGILHIKDLLGELASGRAPPDLAKLVRPCPMVDERMPVERLLLELRRRHPFAFVRGPGGAWTGAVTLDDVLETVVGPIEDEFESEPRLSLSRALTAERIVLDLRSEGVERAIRDILLRVSVGEPPGAAGSFAEAVLERERVAETYLGRGVAAPRARVAGLNAPVLIFARSSEGVPGWSPTERTDLIFLLLTPSDAPGDQVRLLERVILLIESDLMLERLRSAPDPRAVVEILRAAESVAQSPVEDPDGGHLGMGRVSLP